MVKRFGENAALDDFELEIAPGQILSLLGPSGCGKTTALRVIAGFEDPDSGSLTIDGVTVVDDTVNLPPEQRRVGMVFQDYALFPHMTVARNVGYGLEPGPDVGRVAEVLELVGLATHSDRMPHELSGGEQQRVALARALAPRPALILLDEPFSNLDAGLRDRMRRDVRHILKDAGTTAVFVTHDQEEALATSDVVAVMRAGRVLQVDTPQRLYRAPVDPWVANFVGDGEFFDGEANLGFVETPLGTFPQTTSHRGDVTVMVRPEWIHPTRSNTGSAVVVDQEFYGHDQLIVLEFPDGRRLNSRIGASPTFTIGDRADVGVDEIVVFPKNA
jgi:iron(III) transport system ATP-binding protein